MNDPLVRYVATVQLESPDGTCETHIAEATTPEAVAETSLGYLPPDAQDAMKAKLDEKRSWWQGSLPFGSVKCADGRMATVTVRKKGWPFT